MTSFSEQIAAFNRKAEKRIRAASRTAVQETVSEMTRPRPKGRMRVDTGFLRSSIQAAIGRMPAGPTTNEDGTDYGDGERDGLPDKQVAGEPLAITLLRWDPNTAETLFIGLTANYARPREYRDGFMRGAVENWDQNVEKASAEAQRRIP